jgi:hypothetical protein
MITRQYVHVAGSHLSDKDAENIGLAIEQLEKKLGRSASIEEFAKAVKSKSNPANSVVTRKYKELTSNAWHDASRYCLTNVDVIEIIGNERLPAKKAYYLLELSSSKNKDSSTVMNWQVIENSEEAKSLIENRLRTELRCTLSDLADIVGTKRAAEIVKEEMIDIVRVRDLTQHQAEHSVA